MKRRILIVEDDPVGRHVVHTFLRQQGFDTLLAGDATAALTEARKQPDAIILDLGLPAGGGFTFLQRLKQFPSLAVIPVLVVSGHERATHEGKAFELGANAYLQKPASNELILAEIEKLLGA